MLLFGASWAALGALLAASGAVLGPLGGVLGPPWPLLGLILASRGPLVGAFLGLFFRRPCKIAKTTKSADSTALFEVFRGLGGSRVVPKSLQNRSRRPLEASLAASWAVLSGLRWLLGGSWAFLSGLGCKQASELSANQRNAAANQLRSPSKTIISRTESRRSA